MRASFFVCLAACFLSAVFRTVVAALERRNTGRLYAGQREQDTFVPGRAHDGHLLAHSYRPCPDVGNGTSLFRVDSIQLEPERITRGSTATFRIGAALEEMESEFVRTIESGRVTMRVQYGGIQVFSEEDSICDVVETCPLPRDGERFEVMYVKDFPYFTPPGKYEVELRGEVGDGVASLFCVRVTFRVALW
jgi:hypothetical protein